MHGLDEADLKFLSCCAMNNLVIVNIFFQKKKDIYNQSWQHPGMRMWHCIDFVMMRQSQHRQCLDIQVMRGADCWTNHRMVRAKVNVQVKYNVSSYKSQAAIARQPNMRTP